MLVWSEIEIDCSKPLFVVTSELRTAQPDVAIVDARERRSGRAERAQHTVDVELRQSRVGVVSHDHVLLLAERENRGCVGLQTFRRDFANRETRGEAAYRVHA